MDSGLGCARFEYCPDSKDPRIDINYISIRRESFGSMSIWGSLLSGWVVNLSMNITNHHSMYTMYMTLFLHLFTSLGCFCWCTSFSGLAFKVFCLPLQVTRLEPCFLAKSHASDLGYLLGISWVALISLFLFCNIRNVYIYIYIEREREIYDILRYILQYMCKLLHVCRVSDSDIRTCQTFIVWGLWPQSVDFCNFGTILT